MKIGLAVNDIQTERPGYTTTQIALGAIRRGHQVWYIGVADFAYQPDERVHARAHPVPERNYRYARTLLRDVQSDKAVVEMISVDQLDVLMLRNDPSEDAVTRPWARLAGINFGRLALRHGVIVLNDPDGLTLAVNKLYLQLFPEAVRPRALISRDTAQIKDFAHELGDTVVLKPLVGSGGRNVFLVRPREIENINQMIAAVARDGYVIAQEYLPEAVNGDTRLIMMNGDILRYKGKVAAIRRVPAAGDMRNNLAAGGTAQAAEISEDMMAIVDLVRPRLVKDGMFLVGLDIVGDKLLEINVFSPGGLMSASQLNGARFEFEIIRALERKVDHRSRDGTQLNNAEIATL